MAKITINGTPASEVIRVPNHVDVVVNAYGGNDTIYGGFDCREDIHVDDGDNIVFAGNSSIDTMHSGSGVNKFVFASHHQSPNQGGKRATIHGFKSNDLIEIFWATAETCDITWSPIQGGKGYRILWNYTGEGPIGDAPGFDMAVDVFGAEPTMANFTFGSAADYA